MKKGHILLIIPLPPPVHGSAIVSQSIKDSRLLQDEFVMDFVNLSTSRRTEDIGKCEFTLYIRKIGRFLFSYGKTFWLLVAHQYDLCYIALTCHGIGFLKDMPFVLLCKLFGRKIIIHQHNKGMSKDINRWPYCWLLPLCYRGAKVILLSWYLYSDIEKVVPKENVVICPNGIPVVDYEYKERNNSVPRLLFLSNLIPSKGVYVLLDALKILQKREVSFICDFVGGETKEISASRFAEEVNKRGLNHLVVYHGKKYGEDKKQMFEKSDIFVLPTSDDCFPLVLLEAMQEHLPCISTAIGGITDIIKNGENGLIAKKQDSSSLADCIEKLISNPELRVKMGKAGRRKLQSQFTERLFEDRLREILLKASSVSES